MAREHYVVHVAPVFVAGYTAAAQALAEHAVIVEDPRVLTTFDVDVMTMLRQSPRAYSVYAHVLDYGILVERTGRFGFDEQHVVVAYPVPHTDPEFADRLAEVLVPIAELMLADAADQSHRERAALAPNAPIEAWEAVTEVTA